MNTRQERQMWRLYAALDHEHRAVWYVIDLMRHARLSSGTVYTLLRRLENQGSVVRRQNPNSGRFEYVLTERDWPT